MLHKEADESGKVDWRQISGLNEHGSYHSEVEASECEKIVEETRVYEKAHLKQMLGFFETVQASFQENKLKHVQGIYDSKMREFLKGKSELEIFVYCNGKFEKCKSGH